MTRFAVAATLALIFAGCATVPRTNNTGPEIEPAKYEDAEYPTIFSRTPATERGGLAQASNDASKRGWTLVHQGDFPAAMRRFNQAWSLDPTNASALWGMAIIEYEQAKRHSGSRATPADLAQLDLAVALIEEAMAVPSPEASLLNDGAMIVMTRDGMRAYLNFDGSAEDFAHAEALLRRAEAIQVHPLIYENRAALERYRGRPELAEEYATKALRLRGGRAGE